MSACGGPTSPAIERALRVQQEASSQGFDWPDIKGVLDKLHEEVEEIRAAATEGRSDLAKAELGDLLFAVLNLARFLDADPCAELAHATERFCRRFALLKQEIAHSGRAMPEWDLEELDAVWERIKRVRDEAKNPIDNRAADGANSLLFKSR